MKIFNKEVKELKFFVNYVDINIQLNKDND